MTNIETLYHKTYSGDPRHESSYQIDNYESNKDLIKSADPSVSNPDYDGIMRLTADYALVLYKNGKSKKALPYLDKAINLFQNSSIKDLYKVPMYETLLLSRGIVNYNNRKYSIASNDFVWLVTSDPESCKYRNWLLAAKTYKQKRYLNIAWRLALFCLLFHSFIVREHDSLRRLLLWIGIASLGVAVIQEANLYFVKRKVRKTAYNNGFKL